MTNTTTGGNEMTTTATEQAERLSDLVTVYQDVSNNTGVTYAIYVTSTDRWGAAKLSDWIDTTNRPNRLAWVSPDEPPSYTEAGLAVLVGA